MASSPREEDAELGPSTDRESFEEYLKESKRIVALVGAGLSAASGLQTFRGAGGLWRTHNATDLATLEAFEENPDLVWQFYSFRRHMALKAAPNKGHYALTELSRKNKDFITLSQNVDGLSQRAKHPSEQLHLLHGSLFNIKCTGFYCNYTREDFVDPIVPALAIPKKSALHAAEKKTAMPVKENEEEKEADKKEADVKGAEAEKKEVEEKEPDEKEVEAENKEAKTPEESKKRKSEELKENPDDSDEEIDISDIGNFIPHLSVEELPQCPKCEGLLRPGVVWFGEPLPTDTLAKVEDWIYSAPIDLMLVIGTSSQVYPAAGYIKTARGQGARIAVINMEPYDWLTAPVPLYEDDWHFEGDSSVILPDILKGVIGKI